MIQITLIKTAKPKWLNRHSQYIGEILTQMHFTERYIDNVKVAVTTGFKILHFFNIVCAFSGQTTHTCSKKTDKEPTTDDTIRWIVFQKIF